jgi:hypothetical protein
MKPAKKTIKLLKLKPLPGEGGYYRETYRSGEQIKAGRRSKRSLATAIYYLVTPESFSSLHRVKSDELFHFYAGQPVEMLLLYPGGRSRIILLGSDFERGQRPQVLVPKNVWQGCRLIKGGRWALLGTTVFPGFEFEDYQQGKKEPLIERFPSRKNMITALCRK